jgi:formamidopyrimidine-DNA glycosylase
MKPRRHAKLSQREAKTAMQGKTAEALEEFWKWVEETPAPTLTQIEDAVLEFRQRIGQAMAQAAIQAQAAVQPAPGPRCPHCGQEMQLKGTKDKTITARVGDVDLERSHYYCPRCQEGLFPPR